MYHRARQARRRQSYAHVTVSVARRFGGKVQQFSHPFGVCDRRLLDLIWPYEKCASRALVSLLTLLQRFLVGDSDLRYFEDGRHFEDGELPHHILHFADRDALAPNIRAYNFSVLYYKG